MTVGELRRLLKGVDDDTPVVASEYNDGYGGLFHAGAALVTTRQLPELDYYEEYCDNGDTVVLAVGPQFGDSL